MCSTAKSTIAIGIHRNDVFCHAELAPIAIGTASRFYGKDSVPMVIGIHRNDILYCTDAINRIPDNIVRTWQCRVPTYNFKLAKH